MADELVVLVDENDNEIGTMEKIAVHERGGRLHRAFSVFLFHPDGQRMLLQRRAMRKYHFPGLWTNACCSHPRPGEAVETAAHRRLREELGIDAELTERFAFVYRAEDETSGLTEHELDHVFTGTFDGDFTLNPDEVDSVRWMTLDGLSAELSESPERFTPWFQIALPKVAAALLPER